jgi:O-antigen/teichoic acid export membrane protein
LVSVKKIVGSSLFKVTSLNSISVIIKLLIGIVSSKVVAVFLGAPGMALVGNMRNFFSSIETITTLGFQNGIVKYTAENKDDEDRLKRVISTVFIALLVSSVLFALALFIFSNFWNNQVFGERNNYDFVISILAISIPFYVMNVFFTSILNGFGKFHKVIYIAIFGNIIGLLISVILIWKLNIAGALISIAATPALLLIVAYLYFRSLMNVREYIHFRHFDFDVIRNLSSFSLMAFVSGFFGPLVYLNIRNNVIEKLGEEQAGYWSAMERISSNYLLFISTLLTVYFLPKLIMAVNNHETKKEFYSYYKTILPLFIFVAAIIYILRDFIVKLLFTKEFLPVEDLFQWQLIGDTFKVASMILGYEFFAKKMTLAFIVTELMSLGVLYVSSILFIDFYGIEGIVKAHAFTYAFYFLVLGVYFKIKMKPVGSVY